MTLIRSYVASSGVPRRPDLPIPLCVPLPDPLVVLEPDVPDCVVAISATPLAFRCSVGDWTALRDGLLFNPMRTRYALVERARASCRRQRLSMGPVEAV